MENKEKSTKEKKNYTPEYIPILPLTNDVLFPKMVLPLILKDEAYVRMVEDVMEKDVLLAVSKIKQDDEGAGKIANVHNMGTLARVIKISRTVEATVVVVQGLSRVTIDEVASNGQYYRGKIQKMDSAVYSDRDLGDLMDNAMKLFKELVTLTPDIPDEMIHLSRSVRDPGPFADMVTAYLNMDSKKKQEILECVDIKARLEKVTLFLNQELDRKRMGQKIQSQVQKGIDKTQREYYLREQLKAIQRELGMDKKESSEIDEMREWLEGKALPEHARKVAEKEIEKLARMNPSSSEYTVSMNYLDWILELPWSEGTRDKLNIKKAEKVLNRHHYDLEKVKKRILEYLSVRKLNPDHKGPILCLVGPPGTGKTSLGRSIAEAIGRKFVRISLGGVRDEAEIRGHRRTYVGALPGRIIQGMKRAGSNNPLFMLDEVDKLGADFRGDPSSALLEVLDPEQNFSFSDHYLEVEFDLSKVMFITTANQLDTIPQPLLDRMEVIQLPGYIEEDKIEIVRKFIIPRQIREHGLEPKRISFRKAAVQKIIREYTREAGLRNLEREIGAICRGVARRIAEGEEGAFIIKAGEVRKYLGLPRYSSDLGDRTSMPGVATGMAWTPAGGDILFVEASMMPGKKSLVLTGQLGDVMKESAQAALTYLRSKAGDLGIAEDFFSDHDLHIHVPAGAIPKDGPSAGVTMLAAMASLLTCRPIKDKLAMTGEVTLRGSVLPVGGIKEKVLAARRSGIKEIILPKNNKNDLEEIPDKIKSDLNFHLVGRMEDVLKLALEEPVGSSCN